MGIKTYNPYTPSRRNMTGSDFSEITKTTPEKSLVTSLKLSLKRRTLDVIIRVKSQLDTRVVEIEENTDLSISREIRKTVFQQL